MGALYQQRRFEPWIPFSASCIVKLLDLRVSKYTLMRTLSAQVWILHRSGRDGSEYDHGFGGDCYRCPRQMGDRSSWIVTMRELWCSLTQLVFLSVCIIGEAGIQVVDVGACLQQWLKLRRGLRCRTRRRPAMDAGRCYMKSPIFTSRALHPSAEYL
jgi:hypothetical protein